MSSIVGRSLDRIPFDLDGVVGIARSGMLPATMIALQRNVMVCDVDSFLAGRPPEPGKSRYKRRVNLDVSQWKKILLVDDSVASGGSMREAIEKISSARPDVKITSLAVFGLDKDAEFCNLVLNVCPFPRVFEWNLFHHPHHMKDACLDIDGVLCLDPTSEQNDDGVLYKDFLVNAAPKFVPTVKVGYLVTSRLEKYRAQTEDWLFRHHVDYGKLIMLDLPDAATRRRLGAHGPFKAQVFGSLKDSWLFVESEAAQAQTIREITGKNVICIDEMLSLPESTSSFLERAIRKVYLKVRKRF
jgi:uncharacterized HAD superfamily protein